MDECQSFSVGVAAFFINKVLNIRARIAIALGDVIPNPLMSDPPHVGSTLDDITLITPDVRQVLAARLRPNLITEEGKRNILTNHRPTCKPVGRSR